MSPPKSSNRKTKKAVKKRQTGVVKKRQTRVVKKFDGGDDISRVNTDSDEIGHCIEIQAESQSRKRSCSSFEELDQVACTSVSSDLPPPAKRRKNAPVKRKTMPLEHGEKSSKKTSTKAPTKRKTPVKKRLPSKRTGSPRPTKKTAIPLESSTFSQSEPTEEPSHQPTNPPSQTCQPEANQPITKTTTAPQTVTIVTEPPKDQTDQPLQDAKAASESKRTFWFWPWSSASQNDSGLSDEPVPTVLIDAPLLSVEIPTPEKDQLENTDEEIPKKPEVSNPEKDEETT